MKKTFFAAAAAFCLSLAIPNISSQAAPSNDSLPAVTDSIVVYGPVISSENKRIHIDNISSASLLGEIVLTVSDDTLILDSVTGYPVPLSKISQNETVYAYIGPAMTMSIPPITNASLVLSNVPADYAVPSYEIVLSAEPSENGAATVITTYSGKEITVSAEECAILPYLTKNIVTVCDLVPETPVLIWTDGTASKAASASKIVIFPKQSQPGWTMEDDSWYYVKEDGTRHTGWLLDSGDWYYLDPNTGIMKTGFLVDKGKTYYLEDSGRMLSSPRTFTPDSSGALN